MQSDVTEPLNVGSAQLVTINELVSIVEEIAGLRLRRRYRLDAPQGVRGRNSDNTLIKQRLGWEPEISLEEGLEKTYAWMYEEMAGRSSRRAQVVFSAAAENPPPVPVENSVLVDRAGRRA
jgi:GDP-D-mannose 3',5'-epimerase